MNFRIYWDVLDSCGFSLYSPNGIKTGNGSEINGTKRTKETIQVPTAPYMSLAGPVYLVRRRLGPITVAPYGLKCVYVYWFDIMRYVS